MGDRSENVIGQKIDRCFADTLLKIFAGTAVGIVTSFALFKGKSFPVWLGTGVGLGSGWTNCSHDFKSPYLLHGKIVKDGSGKEILQLVDPTIKN